MNMLKWIDVYKNESTEVFNTIPNKQIQRFVQMIFEAYENEQTVFACGNGGNVASVQNLVVDMNMHPFVSEDKGAQTIPRNNFKCVSLCSDQATITGVSNDLGFRFIFSEQLKYQGKKGDVVFGMSGSGNSQNVLEAFRVAKEKGMKTILVTRNEINKCNDFSDLTISLTGESIFPGQTGGNNNNFHFEDFLSKLTHIAVGLLKEKVNNEN
jgi:D-sedoheptulose 7-phosphate isomerase|tara:strand:- start:7454 stop:8086 length:633 start_codon:yes stop_codon:yes gene_type:complete